MQPQISDNVFAVTLYICNFSGNYRPRLEPSGWHCHPSRFSQAYKAMTSTAWETQWLKRVLCAHSWSSGISSQTFSTKLWSFNHLYFIKVSHTLCFIQMWILKWLRKLSLCLGEQKLTPCYCPQLAEWVTIMAMHMMHLSLSWVVFESSCLQKRSYIITSWWQTRDQHCLNLITCQYVMSVHPWQEHPWPEQVKDCMHKSILYLGLVSEQEIWKRHVHAGSQRVLVWKALQPKFGMTWVAGMVQLAPPAVVVAVTSIKQTK